jgi:hypothetical protein
MVAAAPEFVDLIFTGAAQMRDRQSSAGVRDEPHAKANAAAKPGGEPLGAESATFYQLQG